MGTQLFTLCRVSELLMCTACRQRLLQGFSRGTFTQFTPMDYSLASAQTIGTYAWRWWNGYGSPGSLLALLAFSWA